jgi:hypothetical protein
MLTIVAGKCWAKGIRRSFCRLSYFSLSIRQRSALLHHEAFVVARRTQGDFGLSMAGVNSGYPRLVFWEPMG